MRDVYSALELRGCKFDLNKRLVNHYYINRMNNFLKHKYLQLRCKPWDFYFLLIYFRFNDATNKAIVDQIISEVEGMSGGASNSEDSLARFTRDEIKCKLRPE